MNAIYIDSSKTEEITVTLQIGKKKDTLQTKSTTIQGSQVILTSVVALLKKNKLTLQDIEHLYVNTGPGSFTGLRVGTAIANALSFALKILVNDKKLGEIVEPSYT